jgi:AraC-like DNA-binding protein
MGMSPRIVLEAEGADGAEDVLRSVYLPVRVRSRPQGAHVRLRLETLTIGRILIGRLRFAASAWLATDEIANFHVNLGMTGRVRYRVPGREEIMCGPGTAAVFMPDVPVECEWPAEAEQLCLMLGAHEVERELGNLLGSPPRTRLSFAGKMDLRTPAGQSWTQTLSLIDREAHREQGLLSHPLSERRLEQILIDGLLFGQPHNYSEELTGEPVSPGRRTVRRAAEILQGHPEHPWTIGELAAEVAVSARTLQSGFRSVVGMAPMSYLQQVRLQRAQEDLEDTDPGETTVSAVANRWGFLHLGRFAAAYRHRFGESPSQTLRRNC